MALSFTVMTEAQTGTGTAPQTKQSAPAASPQAPLQLQNMGETPKTIRFLRLIRSSLRPMRLVSIR